MKTPEEWFAASRVNPLLDLRLIQSSAERAEVAVAARADFMQEQGVVHGGLLTLLADTAAVYLTLPMLAEGERMTSIEFKVNFLEAALPGGEDLRAVATPVRAGKRVIVAECAVFQGERRILVGLFTYLRTAARG